MSDDARADASSKDEGDGDDGGVRRTLTIVNAKGLHARAAAKFVRCAEMFNAEVRVARQDNDVSGQSIMGLLLLAASPGSSIEVTAHGPEAADAVAALAALVEGGFEEG